MGLSFPTPNSVGWSRFDGSATDELGNVVGVWADPVERAVIGWSDVAVETSSGDGHAAQEKFDLELLVPPSFAPGTRDRIVLEGKLFEVVGGSRQIGFHQWNPGRCVKLRRVEG